MLLKAVTRCLVFELVIDIMADMFAWLSSPFRVMVYKIHMGFVLVGLGGRASRVGASVVMWLA